MSNTDDISELTLLRAERDMFERWVSMGGRPTGILCTVKPGAEHEIYGEIVTDNRCGGYSCLRHAVEVLQQEAHVV